jgi:hypothetical protein
MEFKSGDRVQVESKSTERPPRRGVVEEVVQRDGLLSLSDQLGRRAREHLHPAVGAPESRRAEQEGIAPKAQGARPIAANAGGRASSREPQRPTALGRARTPSPERRTSDATITAG